MAANPLTKHDTTSTIFKNLLETGHLGLGQTMLVARRLPKRSSYEEHDVQTLAPTAHENNVATHFLWQLD